MCYRVLIFELLLLSVLVSCTSSDRPDPARRYDATKNEWLSTARSKVGRNRLDELLNNSSHALIAVYRKCDIVSYDAAGVFNFQLTFTPILALKGKPPTTDVYLHVHSPGRLGLQPETNNGKHFLMFLNSNNRSDNHYSEGIELVQTIPLDR
jgi:hypothetical protein